MKLLECPEILSIPPEITKELFKLSDYIVSTFDCYLPIKDLYRFWIYVSLEHQVLWLSIDYHPEDMSRQDFLIDCLSRYCKLA